MSKLAQVIQGGASTFIAAAVGLFQPPPKETEAEKQARLDLANTVFYQHEKELHDRELTRLNNRLKRLREEAGYATLNHWYAQARETQLMADELEEKIRVFENKPSRLATVADVKRPPNQSIKDEFGEYFTNSAGHWQYISTSGSMANCDKEWEKELDKKWADSSQKKPAMKWTDPRLKEIAEYQQLVRTAAERYKAVIRTTSAEIKATDPIVRPNVCLYCGQNYVVNGKPCEHCGAPTPNRCAYCKNLYVGEHCPTCMY